MWGSYAYTGIGLTTLWCAAAVLLVVSAAPVFWASVAAGLAVLTGQHCAVLLAGATLYLVAERGWKPALGFVIGTGVVVAIGLAFVGRSVDAMWTSVVMTHSYHLDGADLSSGKDALLFTTWALDQLPLLSLACLAISAGRLERWLFGLVAAHIAVVAGMGSGQELYLYPTLPLLALLAARGAGVLTQRAGASAILAACVSASATTHGIHGRRPRVSTRWRVSRARPSQRGSPTSCDPVGSRTVPCSDIRRSPTSSRSTSVAESRVATPTSIRGGRCRVQ